MLQRYRSHDIAFLRLLGLRDVRGVGGGLTDYTRPMTSSIVVRFTASSSRRFRV